MMKRCDACKNDVYEPKSVYQLIINLHKYELCRYCIWKVCDMLEIEVDRYDTNKE